MLIGYASKKLEKICEIEKAAKKALPAASASRIFRKLEALAAFNNLAEIPFRAPPLDFHPLTGDRAGSYSIKIHRLDRICFHPVGDFITLEDGSADLASVTEVEVNFVGDYHSYG